MVTEHNTSIRSLWIYRTLMPFLIGGLLMGFLGIYTMHEQYGKLCGEINWQSPTCQTLREHWND